MEKSKVPLLMVSEVTSAASASNERLAATKIDFKNLISMRLQNILKRKTSSTELTKRVTGY